MGIVNVTLEVGSPQRENFQPVEETVDTGFGLHRPASRPAPQPGSKRGAHRQIMARRRQRGGCRHRHHVGQTPGHRGPHPGNLRPRVTSGPAGSRHPGGDTPGRRPNQPPADSHRPAALLTIPSPAPPKEHKTMIKEYSCETKRVYLTILHRPRHPHVRYRSNSNLTSPGKSSTSGLPGRVAGGPAGQEAQKAGARATAQ